jgi:ribonuclease PH
VDGRLALANPVRMAPGEHVENWYQMAKRPTGHEQRQRERKREREREMSLIII